MPFKDFRLAARQLLTITSLTEKEGQFLGGLCYRSAPLSEKQANWITILLARHDLPTLDGSAGND